MPGNAVAVLIITPEGIPLIRDPKKPAPVFWKVPGGRGHEDRGSHILSLYSAKLDAMPLLKSIGDEGEEIKIFSSKQILLMRDFFPNHRLAYEKILKDL